MRTGNTVFAALGTTIFTTMSALATEHDAINLGQGFPDGEGPEDLRQKAAEALMRGPNQYPPMRGLPVLRQAVASANRRFYGLDVDPDKEVIVTSGATEALCDTLWALLQPGDEAIVLEPAYDSYRPIIEASGATCIAVSLTAPHWDLPREQLEAAFGPRTKLLVLNSPMNPCGKVFTPEELDFLGDLVCRHDAYAVCDEVYEHLFFSGHAHIPLMTRPGMRDRTVRIGSAGKTFSLTGWKIGYITASPELSDLIAKTHQFVTFTTAPALQTAIAHGLGYEDGYFTGLAQDLEAKRDRLAAGLQRVGFGVLPSQGTYFVTCDISGLRRNQEDEDFCKELTRSAGVAAVPVSAFYADREKAPRNLIRFCFCKDNSLLDNASDRLLRYLGEGA